MEGKSSSWLYKYKLGGHTIELYTKGELKQYVTVLKNALLMYYNN